MVVPSPPGRYWDVSMLWGVTAYLRDDQRTSGSASAAGRVLGFWFDPIIFILYHPLSCFIMVNINTFHDELAMWKLHVKFQTLPYHITSYLDLIGFYSWRFYRIAGCPSAEHALHHSDSFLSSVSQHFEQLVPSFATFCSLHKPQDMKHATLLDPQESFDSPGQLTRMVTRLTWRVTASDCANIVRCTRCYKSNIFGQIYSLSNFINNV